MKQRACFLATTVVLGVVFGIPCLGKTIVEPAQRASALRDLGRQLFLDPQFSRDGRISCSSCHKPEQAFSDGRRLAIGTDEQTGTRNAPSLLSLTEAPFFWDGRARTLETVVLQPFTNPAEMGLNDEADLLKHVQQSAKYRAAFSSAFSESSGSPSVEEVRQALVAYVRSVNVGTSAYEHWASGDSNALSGKQLHGLELFRGTAGCAECHRLEGTPVHFTDKSFHSTVINPQLARALPDAAVQLSHEEITPAALNARIESDPVTSELGRFVVTHDPKDIGAFRTPSLRNIALTAPYMHDGSATTLRDAVDREIYYRSLQSNRPNTLTETDRQDLVAFLDALTAQPKAIVSVRVP